MDPRSANPPRASRSTPEDGPGRMFKTTRLATVTQRERQLLTAIRREGEISRSELIKKTGLAGVAVFRGTEDLAGRGLVEIGETVAQGRGQPSALVRLRPNALVTIGLSVMTDYAEAALMDFTGAVRAVRDLTVPGMPRDAILDGLVQFIADSTLAQGIPASAVYSIGIAVAGYFVGDGNELNPRHELDDWALVDLQAIIEKRTGYPTLVENSANAAAVGERLLGVGAWADSFAYVNITSGLGAGLIVNGELVRGRHGNAGEVGGILKILGLPPASLVSLQEVLRDHGVETDSITDLVRRYDDDWPGVQAWINQHARTFSIVISSLQYVLDGDAIVIGGRAPPALAQRIIDAIEWCEDDSSARRGRSPPAPRIVVAEMSDRSAAVGAAALPLKQGYFL